MCQKSYIILYIPLTKLAISSSVTVTPGFKTITPIGWSPSTLSGTPTTTADLTAGWVRITASTSAGGTFKIQIISLPNFFVQN